MIKVIPLKADNPIELARQIEELQNNNNKVICKGSQVFEFEKCLHSFVYFTEGDTKIKIPENKKEVTKKPFKIKKETIEKWKTEKATESQKKLLEKLGVKNTDKITKYEAYIVIKQSKEDEN